MRPEKPNNKYIISILGYFSLIFGLVAFVGLYLVPYIAILSFTLFIILVLLIAILETKLEDT
jgi:hypothetical protein